MHTAVIVVAAGRGERAGDPDLPKQYRLLGGVPVLTRTIAAFATHPAVDRIVPVIDFGHMKMFHDTAMTFDDRLEPPVQGGATRQASVLAGLDALKGDAPAHVLIHDAARPFVGHDVIGRVLGALETEAAAIPALPVADSLKRGRDGHIADDVARDDLWAAQTPQGFRFAAILAAHTRAAREGRSDFTDDAAVAAWDGLSVALVEGAASNSKLTHPEDFAMAERLMGHTDPSQPGEWRFGHGYDVHAFGNGETVTLCGVELPHDRALTGHSDADVGLHALTDALLGAISEGDIGSHFPPDDPQWRGVASDVFAKDAATRVSSRGGRIVNVDVTLICERPKIAPHRQAMRQRIAEILDIDPGRVSVKATTTEGLGFTGRGEGIAAEATASVWLPGDGSKHV